LSIEDYTVTELYGLKSFDVSEFCEADFTSKVSGVGQNHVHFHFVCKVVLPKDCFVRPKEYPPQKTITKNTLLHVCT